MLFGYDQVTAVAWGLSGGSGTAWLAPDGDAALVDGSPQRRARIRWRNDGSPSTAHTVSLQGAFEAAQSVRLAGLLSLRNIPAGTKVEVRGKRVEDAGYTYALGGNSLTQTVTRLPDGSLGCWWVFDADLDPLVGIEVRVYNDAGGTTVFTASSELDIGELAVFSAVEITVDNDWELALVDPSSRKRSRASQFDILPRPAYRRFTARYTPAFRDQALAGGLGNGLDWQRFEFALSGGRAAAVIPRWAVPGGGVDAEAVQSTAIYGRASNFAARRHTRGDIYDGGVSIEEEAN